MDDTHTVYRLTQEAYDQLRLLAERRPESWLDPEADFGTVLESMDVHDIREPTGITTRHPIALTPAERGPPNRADVQALDFYRMFNGLTPRTAAVDERMWAWMTHFRLHAYGLARWRRSRNVNLVNYVRRHWLGHTGSSAVWRQNTASRTWWIAHTALRAARASSGAFTAEQALKLFSHTASFYHIPMYYNFTRDPVVLAEIVRALLEEAQGINSQDGVYALLGELNLMAGAQMLSLLPRDQLRQTVVDQVERIMSIPALVSDRARIRNPRIFRSLSLGAGVQSTVLALMAERGEHGLQKPDVAIFADTGWEPPSVYEHLDWLQKQLSYPVIRLSAGNIRDNILAGTSPDGNGYLGIPAFLRDKDGAPGKASRQCTTKYKIKPINRYLRKRLGAQPGRRAPKDARAEIWIGLSIDEVYRIKPSREEWADNRFPLIELELSRGQLQKWFADNYPGRYLPRSACIGCPYRDNSQWKWLKVHDPDSFDDAVFVDRALREIPLVKNAISRQGQAFLHRSRIPLAQVDLDDVQDYDEMMLEECEGVCGV